MLLDQGSNDFWLERAFLKKFLKYSNIICLNVLQIDMKLMIRQ